MFTPSLLFWFQAPPQLSEAVGSGVLIIAHWPHGGLHVALALCQGPALAGAPVALAFVPALIDRVQVRDRGGIHVHPVVVVLVPSAAATVRWRRRTVCGEAVATGSGVLIIAHLPHGGLHVPMALRQGPALAGAPVAL